MVEHLSWSFYGRSLPERVPISIQIPNMRSPAGDLANVNIHLSQIIVTLRLNAVEHNVYTLRNRVEHLVRSIVDIIGYRMGISFDIEILSCTSNAGVWHTFSTDVAILYNKKFKNTNLSILSDELNIIASDPAVGIALADFREAMRMPTQTGFLCYRSIEAMMQSVKDRHRTSEKDAWKILRDAINVDRTSIDAIKKHSDWARHGRTGSISDEDRAKIFEITDEMIRRYIEYLRNGKSQLSIEIYPKLEAIG